MPTDIKLTEQFDLARDGTGDFDTVRDTAFLRQQMLLTAARVQAEYAGEPFTDVVVTDIVGSLRTTLQALTDATVTVTTTRPAQQQLRVTATVGTTDITTTLTQGDT